jgi:hypothetical protein
MAVTMRWGSTVSIRTPSEPVYAAPTPMPATASASTQISTLDVAPTRPRPSTTGTVEASRIGTGRSDPDAPALTATTSDIPT